MRPDPALGLTLLIANGLFPLVGLRPGSWVVLSLHSHTDTAEEEPNLGEGRDEGQRNNVFWAPEFPRWMPWSPVSFSVTWAHTHILHLSHSEVGPASWRLRVTPVTTNRRHVKLFRAFYLPAFLPHVSPPVIYQLFLRPLLTLWVPLTSCQ